MEMHQKLKDLTDRIQREGLEKANEEASRILDDAKKEAAEIIGRAKNEANTILENARKDAEKHADKLASELRLASRQSLMQLKKEISELIQAEVIDQPVKKTFEDSAFIKKILESLIKNWKSADQQGGLEVLLPEDQVKEIDEYFKEKAASLMGKGLVFKGNSLLERGFEIQPQNGHYKITMTDEAFEAFMKEHFKPVTIEFLYGEKNK